MADRLLVVARGERPLEHAESPLELAAAFLRRYDNRKATQEAYALDLAGWFVWLVRANVDPFDATLATVEAYICEPLPNGKPAAPSTTARRMACMSNFYRRLAYEGFIERNPRRVRRSSQGPQPGRDRRGRQAACSALDRGRAR